MVENNPNRNAFIQFARSPKTEAHKQHIREALTGKSRPDVALNQTTTWKIIRPLLLRGATPAEVADVTDLKPGQVTKLASFPRTVLRIDDYDSPENRKVRKRKAGFRSNRTRKGIQPTQHEVNSANFAREIVAQGLIDDDVSHWDTLKEIFRDKEASLQDNFAYTLTLEVFLKARMLAIIGDWTLFDKYMDLGRNLEKGWFASDALNADRRTISGALGSVNGEDKFLGRGSYNRSFR